MLQSQGGLTWSDVSLESFRRWLNQNGWLRWARAARLLVHFGPWRPLFRSLVRLSRPAANADLPLSDALLPTLDAESTSAEVRRNSVAVAGVLPEPFVQELRRITDDLPTDHYQLSHLIDENIRRLSEDPAVLATVRSYLGCEPVLLESTLTVTEGMPRDASGQNFFHFDYAGWDSLNVFIYLTEVNQSSACHTVARGSHRNIRWRDLLREVMSDEQAGKRFGDTVVPILGPAGTVFFENTEAFHRRQPSPERRVMLNLLYASHRNWLSHGRTSSTHIRAQRAAYAKARSEKG